MTDRRSAPVLGRSGFECERDLVAFLCFWSKKRAAAEDGSIPDKQIRAASLTGPNAERILGGTPDS